MMDDENENKLNNRFEAVACSLPVSRRMFRASAHMGTINDRNSRKRRGKWNERACCTIVFTRSGRAMNETKVLITQTCEQI